MKKLLITLATFIFLLTGCGKDYTDPQLYLDAYHDAIETTEPGLRDTYEEITKITGTEENYNKMQDSFKNLIGSALEYVEDPETTYNQFVTNLEGVEADTTVAQLNETIATYNESGDVVKGIITKLLNTTFGAAAIVYDSVADLISSDNAQTIFKALSEAKDATEFIQNLEKEGISTEELEGLISDEDKQSFEDLFEF